MRAHGLDSFADIDRLLVVISDIEMGTGGPEDDFVHSAFLGERLLRYNEGRYADLAVSLVFNGDTFDLLKTDHLGRFPRHIGRGIATAKMMRIADAHPAFFAAVRAFLEHARAERQVYFVVGNHDAELLFPEVQRFVAHRCGSNQQVLFPGLTLDIGRVRMEHGSQADPMFRLDPDQLFVPYNGEDVLNISWGSAALLDTVIPLKPLLYFHDRLKPKNQVFALLPDVKELLVGIMWKYWTRDYWQGWFSENDPTRKLSWNIVKEVVSRLGSNDIEVVMDPVYRQELQQSNRFRLRLVGHQHETGWWSFGDRKLLQTGCIRDEYMLGNQGKILRPIPKSLAEVYLTGDEPRISHLVEFEGPQVPAEYLPATIFEVVPKVRSLLGTAAERSEQHAAQQEQEEREESGIVDRGEP
jgi:UDP-2,3-diacylglucosamine pyrophosphatase LpxH